MYIENISANFYDSPNLTFFSFCDILCLALMFCQQTDFHAFFFIINFIFILTIS